MGDVDVEGAILPANTLAPVPAAATLPRVDALVFVLGESVCLPTVGVVFVFKLLPGMDCRATAPLDDVASWSGDMVVLLSGIAVDFVSTSSIVFAKVSGDEVFSAD